jgi:hypothetical protein
LDHPLERRAHARPDSRIDTNDPLDVRRWSVMLEVDEQTVRDAAELFGHDAGQVQQAIQYLRDVTRTATAAARGQRRH